jgi:putative transposase
MKKILIVERAPSPVHGKAAGNDHPNKNIETDANREKLFSPITEFQITYRNLPHWQNPGSVYFVTFRTYHSLILDDVSKQILYDNIVYYSKTKYDLFSFIIMDDHAHLIIQPKSTDPNLFICLPEIMHAVKGYAAKEIKKHLSLMWENADMEKQRLIPDRIFQGEYYDRIIRNDKEFYNTMDYIALNSVKKGLCKNPYDYQWYYY